MTFLQSPGKLALILQPSGLVTLGLQRKVGRWEAYQRSGYSREGAHGATHVDLGVGVSAEVQVAGRQPRAVSIQDRNGLAIHVSHVDDLGQLELRHRPHFHCGDGGCTIPAQSPKSSSDQMNGQ